ncbi:MAG: tetratricopeptide repeat protein [bacterium]|nr:tetratricopeptide repeat protein [bacterium]
MKKNFYITLLSVALICSISTVEARLTKEAHALYQEACQLEYKNNFNGAINIIEKAIAQNGEDAMLYTKLAGLYADTGKYREAISSYKKAINLRPNDAFIYISMGNILQTIGDYDNAYSSFMQAQNIYPEYKYNYLNIANVEYFRKNYDNAIDNYNKFLNAYPNNIEAGENLANVYSLAGKYDKACEIYSNLYRKFPTAFTEFEKYGMALFETKQYQAAVSVLEKALVDNENSESINAKLALAYQNQDENEKALKYFNKTFELNPNLVALRFDYANLLGNMGRSDDAIEQYKIYIKAYPKDADAYRNLGIVYEKINNTDLAIFNLEKSYLYDSSNQQTKKELALCYHKKNDYNNALKYYDLALKTEPDDMGLLANKALTLHAINNYMAAIDIYKNILNKQYNERIEQNLVAASVAYGYDLYDKQDYGQSILYFENAIELNPKEASAFFGYAMANEKLGCRDVALENYRKAVSLAPGNSEYQEKLNSLTMSAGSKTLESESMSSSDNKVHIVTQLATSETQEEKPLTFEQLIFDADSAYKKQDYGKAIDYYTKAIIHKPSDKSLLLKVANTYKMTGDNSKAIGFYDKIIALDENNPDAYFNKGLVYATQKDYDNCIKCFEKVIQLSPDYPYAYYSIAMAYEQKKMPDKALEYYYLYSGLETDQGILSVVEQKIKKLETEQ